jgi:hypothetical protein
MMIADDEKLKWLATEAGAHARNAYALSGLEEGDLRALAVVLRAGDALHPTLAFALAALIDGDVAASGGLRISVGKHPDLARKSQGGIAAHRLRRRNMEIARFMAERGAIRPGEHEAAVSEAVARFDLSRATVEGAWADHKAEARQWASKARVPVSLDDPEND